MGTILYLMVLITMVCVASAGMAQNNNSLSVTNRSSSAFNLSAINRAGKAAEMLLDNSQWINYSINAEPTEPYRSISASITSGQIPPGVEVYLEASHYHGPSSGKSGKPTGKIKLGNVPNILIDEIGECNTGNGKFHGHKLTLSVVVTDYGQLHTGDFNLYIQYTIN